MRSYKIGIFDYSAGNTGSLRSTLNNIGFNHYVVTNDFLVLESVDCIILPGVGSFGHCAEILNKNQEAADFFQQFLSKKDNLLISICIGMQLLADVSEESDGYAGLGLLPGSVRKLRVPDDHKLPHVGWNNIISATDKYSLLTNSGDFYFDHSYIMECDPKYIVASSFYGEDIPAIVKRDNIVGFQFHPELSGKLGADLLKNIIQGEFSC